MRQARTPGRPPTDPGARGVLRDLHAHRLEPLHAPNLRATSTAVSAAFAGSVWADLGPRFEREFLASLVAQPTGVGFVYRCGPRVVGFVLGADDASAHRTTFVRQRWPRLLVLVLTRVARRPQLLGTLVRYARPYLWPRRRVVPASESATEIPPASLILLGVTPDHRRQGIAERLTHVFLHEMARRGVPRVKLVVGADNTPAVAFYRRHGWREAGRHPTPDGTLAYRLIFDLDAPGQSTSVAS